ncbi:MAG TPA: adenylate/guanylate cyclase domain-containing protein [Candidatus Limnocylindrales bacterium]
MAGLRALVRWFVSIADEPTDDDDLRLRKHVGVVAGYVLFLAAFGLPVIGQGLALGWAVALSMLSIVAIDLVVLARTRRFERYVVVLLVCVTLLPAFVEVALGGLGGSSAAFLFAFLGPVFAILALGPRRATAWYVFFLAVMVAVIVLDPILSSTIEPQPYSRRLIFYAANLAIPLTIVFFFLRSTDLRRRQAETRSEELLTNAIPTSIAARLKRSSGQRIADVYPDTTVLFADLVGFTPWAQRTDPDLVLTFLDDLFSRFDEAASTIGVEKIKTIGDSYMAVAGAPEPRDDHAMAALTLARAMLEALAAARIGPGVALELRIGMASGSVVGGVIGQRRIQFDLWGDTVNLASRMESSGVPGRIQVATSTWALLRTDSSLAFERREAVDVKGMGRLTTYLLTDPVPDASPVSGPRVADR